MQGESHKRKEKYIQYLNRLC